MKKSVLFIVLFLMSNIGLAQSGTSGGNTFIRYGAGAPTAGSCSATRIYIDITNNILYIGNPSGTCTAAGGASSITGTGTLHDVPVFSGAQTLANSTGLSESYPTFTVNESQTTNGTQSVIGDITTTQLTAPSTLACVQGAATGGFLLHNQAYFYKVTAISANGQTTVSNESTFTTAASPVGDTYTASCTWTGHAGDTGYKLYRSTTTGTELLLATITPGNTNAYTDNTNTTPSGAMPTVNSTGTISLAGNIAAPQIIGSDAWPTNAITQNNVTPLLVTSSGTNSAVIGSVFYNALATIAADSGFSLYLGPRATTASPDMTWVRLFGGKVNSTSGNYLSYFRILTLNAAGAEVQQAQFDANGATFPAVTSTGAITAPAFAGSTRTGIYNANQAAQSQIVVSATEYYIAHSDLDMPASYTTAIGAGTTMHWRIALTKTAAGTGTFQILLKKGTNGTTGDTSIVTQTIGTQTAVVDNMEVDITLTWTSATAAYWSIVPRQSAASGTGFGLVYPATAAQFNGTISAQTTTTASDKYGISVIFTTGTPTFVVNEVVAQAFGVN